MVERVRWRSIPWSAKRDPLNNTKNGTFQLKVLVQARVNGTLGVQCQAQVDNLELATILFVHFLGVPSFVIYGEIQSWNRVADVLDQLQLSRCI